MADYEVRLWNAWHHHMALVMMAMLFMLIEKLQTKDECPSLSCAAIEKLLAASLSAQGCEPRAKVYSHMKRFYQTPRRADSSFTPNAMRSGDLK